MGKGMKMVCKNCKKEYEFHLGTGFFSLSGNWRNILYFCDSCGYWEEITVPFFFKPLPRLEKINDTIEVVEDIPAKFCLKCNTKMKYLYDFDDTTVEDDLDLACPECNSKLSFKYWFCWD